MDLTLYINKVNTTLNNDPTVVVDLLVDNNIVLDLYIDN